MSIFHLQINTHWFLTNRPYRRKKTKGIKKKNEGVKALNLRVNSSGRMKSDILLLVSLIKF